MLLNRCRLRRRPTLLGRAASRRGRGGSARGIRTRRCAPHGPLPGIRPHRCGSCSGELSSVPTRRCQITPQCGAACARAGNGMRSPGDTQASDGANQAWDGANTDEDGTKTTSHGATRREEGAIPREDGAILGEEGAIPREDGAIPREDGAILGEEGAIPREDGAILGEEGAILREEGARYARYDDMPFLRLTGRPRAHAHDRGDRGRSPRRHQFVLRRPLD